MAEYLVTGGAGFIGSNIVERLVREGLSVRVLDNLATGSELNLAPIAREIDFVHGDITDPDIVRKAIEGVHYVMHLAALPSVPRSIKDPVLTNEVNVRGTLNMLLGARDAKVKKFVYSSSSSVYGDTPTLPKVETMVPRPLSPYAVQKVTGEYYCGVFAKLFGLSTYCLRYFNVFGPKQNPESQYAAVIPLFVKAIQNGEPPTIFGDGEQTRDFTFVDNVVAANLACCDHDGEAQGDVINIAGGQRTSVNQLAGMIMSIVGKEVDLHYESSRAGDVRDSEADLGKVTSTLGWRPEVGLKDGLKKTVEYFIR